MERVLGLRVLSLPSTNKSRRCHRQEKAVGDTIAKETHGQGYQCRRCHRHEKALGDTIAKVKPVGDVIAL